MTRMTGGEAVVAALEANGADLAFGIPGMHNLAIYDALVDRPGFRHIVTRNEQGASFMANAVGRATGRPGICVVTTGPAACNALGGVGDAARESVPMLVIASQIESSLIGQNKGAFHEMADQMGMFEAAGAWSTRPNSVDQIPAAVNAAWVAATHGRPRPAYVEIPHDILVSEGEAEIVPAAPAPRPGVDPERVRDILSRLLAARRPLVYVGSGAARSDAGDELARLAERLSLPVGSTIHGKGVLPEDHPLSLGALPVSDTVCRGLFARADLVLALGTGFSEVTTAYWSTDFGPQVIHVDIDGSQIGRNICPALGLVADARRILAQLNAAAAATAPREPTEWVREVTALRDRIQSRVQGMAGAEVSRVMRALLPRDSIIVGDAARWGGWQIYHYPTYGAGQMLYPIHFGTLGYSVPGAIGAQAAFPGRRVVAVCGDGGFLFCSGELATAMQHGLNVIVILVNNRSYGTIRLLQKGRYGAERVIAADLENPDFVAYAHSFGAFGRRVDQVEGLEPALKEALDANRPAVLELTFRVESSPTDYGLAGTGNLV